jgi:parallel beta-helix repeat protein
MPHLISLFFSATLTILLLTFSRPLAAANCGGLTPCSCGDVLTETRSLLSGVDPVTFTSCTGFGIIIDTDNVTLNCNFLTIDGGGTSPFAGVSIGPRNNVTVKNCLINRFTVGITTADGGTTGSLIDGNLLQNNNVGPQGGIGIAGGSNLSSSNTISNNAVSGSGRGLVLDGSGHIVTQNLIQFGFASGPSGCPGVDCNSLGIQIFGSGVNQFTFNEIKDQRHGIFIDGASNQQILDNISTNNEIGIRVSGSSHTVQGNRVSNNSTGIFVQNSSHNDLIDNLVFDNLTGINLTSDGADSTDNDFHHNQITRNTDTGFLIATTGANITTGNLIYDNLFLNDLNFGTSASGTLGMNEWNIPPISVIGLTNIAGGPSFGGNLWANPSGTGFSEGCADANTDGFCDTSLVLAPNNVDNFPLVGQLEVCNDAIDNDLDGFTDCADSNCAATCADTDGDGVPITTDNCPDNANAHQEDSDGDTLGDKCDSDTFNASFEEGASFHVSTPLYRSKVDHEGCVSVSANSGSGELAALPDIGSQASIDGGAEIDVIKICPTALNIAIGSTLTQNATPTILQSVWQSLTSTDAFSGASVARTHYASGANSIGVGHEVMNLGAVTGDVVATWALTLPAGFALDTSELVGGKGRLTITTGPSSPLPQLRLYRLSAVGCGTNGKPTAIEEDCPSGGLNVPDSDPLLVDANPSEVDFFGFQRMIDELNNTISSPTSATTSCLPSGATSEKIGIAHRDGVTSDMIKMRQEFFEDQADHEIGLWSVAGTAPNFTLTATCPFAFVDKNNEISTRMGIGMGVSSLKPPILPAGVTNLYGKHTVAFDREFHAAPGFAASPTITLDTTWNNVTFTMNNSGPNRFDGGSTTNYSLFANDGKTCAFNDCAQVHTGIGFSGSTVNLTGTTTVNFPAATGGGGGVAMGPGARVAAGDPCLSEPINYTTQTGRCAVNFFKRGKLTFDTLNINGGMRGLSCTGSDCIGNFFNADLGDDPNAVDQNLMRARGAIGCAGAKGVSIGWNVVTNDFEANVPLNTAGCSLGDGSCYPTPLSDPGTTGLCILDVKRVDLMAQPDLAKPAGSGFSCGQQFGKCNLGGASVIASGPTAGQCNFAAAGFPASAISGFETGVNVSGGPNVDPATGQGLRHDALNAIPPLKACLKNLLVFDSETAVATGGNSDVSIYQATLDRCQYSCVATGKVSANIATPANTDNPGTPAYDGCPKNNPGDTVCKSRASDFGSPQIGIGQEDHLAAIAAGITAPVKLTFANSRLGCSPATIMNAGLEPVLPPVMSVDPATKLITCGGANADLTFLGTPACALKFAVSIDQGADQILHSELLQVNVNESNLCTSSPGIFVDQIYTATKAPIDVNTPGTCFAAGATGCDTVGPLLATDVGGGEINSANSEAVASANDDQVLDTGTDSDGDGITDGVEGAFCTSVPGCPACPASLDSCSGKYDMARLILCVGHAQGIVKRGVKNAATKQLDKSQEASIIGADPKTKKCINKLHAAREIVFKKDDEGPDRGQHCHDHEHHGQLRHDCHSHDRDGGPHHHHEDDKKECKINNASKCEFFDDVTVDLLNECC